MNIPFVDLKAQHDTIRPEIDAAIARVIDRANFVLGDEVQKLEEEFASFCESECAVGVDSGLSALQLALEAYGIGPGDEVIVPAFTFVATAAAVTFAGATPVFADVDPETCNIDVTQIEAAITAHTKAIIPVHLYGLPAEMDALMTLAAKHNLTVIEDACQAHGARYRGRRTGSLGHAAAFSFYPSKNLGACGDGGMLVTNDAQIAVRVRAMRNCGQFEKYRHDLAPYNHRLDTLQAAILRVKLPHLDEWNTRRQEHARRYNTLLADSPLGLPTVGSAGGSVFHLYVVRTPDRQALQESLKQQGIGTGIHYPIPLHLQPVFKQLGYHAGDFPAAERLSDQVLSLPMFPEMLPAVSEQVAQGVQHFLDERVGIWSSSLT